MKFLITSLLTLLLQQGGALAAVFTVTNTLDAGAGSLRQAIIDANTNPGADIIRFQIGASGNLMEGSGSAQYAVIELVTPLPVVTGAVLIDGHTQFNTNTGSTTARTAGRDNLSVAAIPLPDVYLVPASTYPFPTGAAGIDGNGLSIDAAGVEVRGLAISGFGNLNTNGGNASAHADISVLRSPVPRTVNARFSGLLLSCDPTGAQPALAHRRSKGNSLLVLGNNETGVIEGNYIGHSGTYAIHFNGNTDNLGVGPSSTTIGNQGWQITSNVLTAISSNTSITSLGRVSDGINLMKCAYFSITRNYISDVEQSAIDVGFNSDHNSISDNTITGITRTNANAPQAGIRLVLCSERNTLHRNAIINNSGTNFRAGVWIDRTSLSQAGVETKPNAHHLVRQNLIHTNNGSGIVVSNNGSGTSVFHTFTENIIYSNTGLGIDLNFNGTSGTTAVTPNDDGDGDAGVNDLMNFPIIDSVRILSPTEVAVYGKAPAGSRIEFFVTDGEANNMGGFALYYGEALTYLGSAVEGSDADLRSGTIAYELDGSFASADALFHVVLPRSGLTVSSQLTATATLNGNTSEMGPSTQIFSTLAVKLTDFRAQAGEWGHLLEWKANHDGDFQFFEVEYSRDGRSFSTLARVHPKAGLSSSTYHYRHQQPGAGTHLYRLRMVNSHERAQYSRIVSIGAEAGEGIRLSSWDFRGGLLQVSVQSGAALKAELVLTDLAGRPMAQQSVRLTGGRNALTIPLRQPVPDGIYLLQVITREGRSAWKLLKNGESN